MINDIISFTESTGFKKKFKEQLISKEKDGGYLTQINSNLFNEPFMNTTVMAHIKVIVSQQGKYISCSRDIICTHCDDAISVDNNDGDFLGSVYRASLVDSIKKIKSPESKSGIQYRKKIAYFAKYVPAYKAIEKMFSNKTEMKKLISDIDNIYKENDNVYFIVQGSKNPQNIPAHLLDETIVALKQRYKNCYISNKNNRHCSICGKTTFPIGSNFGMVKGQGIKSTGVALITHNDKAQQSRHGMIGNDISGVCVDCGRRLVHSMNYCLSLQESHINFGNSNYILFLKSNSSNKAKEYPIMDLFNAVLQKIGIEIKPKDDADVITDIEIEKVRNRKKEIMSVLFEKNPEFSSKDSEVEIIKLQTVPGRMSITAHYQEKYEDIDKRINFVIDNSSYIFKNQKYFVPINYYKGTYIQNDYSKQQDHYPTKKLIDSIYRFIFFGEIVPNYVLEQVSQQMKSDILANGKISFKVLALSRLLYNIMHYGKEGLSMTLDENNTSSPYIAGRLLAEMVSMERVAYPKRGINVLEGFRVPLSVSPLRTFEIIYRIYDTYKKIGSKKNPGAVYRIDTRVSELISKWNNRTPYHGKDFVEYINGFNVQQDFNRQEAAKYKAKNAEENQE